MLVAVKGTPRVVVVLDATTSSSLLSLLEPAQCLHDVVVIAPTTPPGLTDAWNLSWTSVNEAMTTYVRPGAVVLSSGHYLRLGALAWHISQQVNARFVTVQHGLLTPHAPPLAPGTTLLAWSAADGAYWAAGRPDVTTQVVGSTLLWSASRSLANAAAPTPDERPVYLGQIHGAELPRWGLARSARRFCRSTPATYRPHPSETDRLSRLIHRRFEGEGIVIDRGGVPLRDLRAPVVSVFSTGVLEAAAAGRSAWVHYENAPTWLREFWARYDMSHWGGPPTPPPPVPDLNPADAIRQAVEEMMEQ